MNGRAILRLAAVVAACLAPGLAVAPRAGAHEGPPYPILVDQRIGTVQLSVWADPDVGIGTYHVYLEPLEGGTPLPDRCEVRVFVQPVTGRLPERGYLAEPYRISDRRHHYLAEVEFDAEEDWTTRIVVRAGGSEGEASTVVAVTPPGQGPLLDFVLYLFPFVAVGFLVVRALLRGRARRGDRAPRPPRGASR